MNSTRKIVATHMSRMPSQHVHAQARLRSQLRNLRTTPRARTYSHVTRAHERTRRDDWRSQWETPRRPQANASLEAATHGDVSLWLGAMAMGALLALGLATQNFSVSGDDTLGVGETPVEHMTPEQLALADQFFDDGKWLELLEYLGGFPLGSGEDDAGWNKADNAAHFGARSWHSPEWLWRRARALYKFAENHTDAELAALAPAYVTRRALIYNAFRTAQEALERRGGDELSGAHKWLAILYSAVGDYEGTTAQIQNSFLIRDHFLRAVEIDPSDATAVHLLGVWCFTFADMSWVTRKVASTVFASPPTSDYDEALAYFERAEKIDPGFYLKNRMYIGKTLLRLGKKDEAKKWLEQAVAMKAEDKDNQDAKDEATTLLSGIA